MEKYADEVPKHNKLNRIIADGANAQEPKSWSETHGGFENDVQTMNNLLTNVLGKKPKRLFTEKELDY